MLTCHYPIRLFGVLWDYFRMSKNIRKTGGEWTSFFFFRCIFIAFVGAFFRFLVLCSSSFVFETMRFRAKISNADLLHKTVQTIQKTSKTCVIQLGPESVLFLHSPGMSDGVQIWSNVKVRALFSPEEYAIESMRNNEIAFEVFLESLRVAIKSGLMSDDILVRLTKKDRIPYLSFQIKNLQGPQEVIVCHDVPVQMVTGQRMSEITQPSLPDPKVQLVLPQLKSMQAVVDSMKNLANVLTIRADLGGNLTLAVETDVVQMSSYYRDLEIPSIEGRNPIENDASVVATVRVDIKKFLKFLYSSTIEPLNVICCLVEEHALTFHVLLNDMFMTYYVPLVD